MSVNTMEPAENAGGQHGRSREGDAPDRQPKELTAAAEPQTGHTERLESAITSSDQSIGAGMHRTLSILIVDDDRLDRASVCRALVRDGLHISAVEVDTCSEALEHLKGRKFDCAFVDYLLPDGSGLGLLKDIREHDEDLPVIMLTGQGSEEVAVDALKAGATDYVAKGASTTAITQSLRSAMRVHHHNVERRKAEDALRQSEERCRLLLEGARDYAIFLVDLEGRITTWNAGAERIFGYSEEEIVGQPMALLFTEDDRQWRVPEDVMRTARRLGRSEDTRLHLRSDGSTFWADGMFLLVHDDAGEIHGYEMILRDCTQRKRAEEMLNEAKAQQFRFVRDILRSVTDGKLRLCQHNSDLPQPCRRFDRPVFLDSSENIAILRRQARLAGIAQGCSQESVNDLMTAVSEAAMNAVVHANGGRGQVCVGDDGRVQVWIEDDGLGISMDALPKATLQRGYTTAGTLGHGFKLLLQTVDCLWLLTGSKGTVLALEVGRLRPDAMAKFQQD